MQGRIEERQVTVGALPTRYLTGGEGQPLVLLHGVSESARSWSRILPALARDWRVYAPDFPGFGGGDVPDEVSPVAYADFIAAFLDALGLERATVAGHSFGGLVATRLALAHPGRVAGLGLVASAGLGREVHPALRMLTLPGIGGAVARWGRTRPGAVGWALQVGALLFARPAHVPLAWLGRQYRLARQPGFLDATVAGLRSVLTIRGQRQSQLVLDALPRLTMPTLVVWGAQDRVSPVRHAEAAVTRLAQGHLAIIPECGHLPQVECAEPVVSALARLLSGGAPSAPA